MVATPFILSHLGEERFAIFRILIDWLSHLSLLEFGLYSAVMGFMAKTLGENRSRTGAALMACLRKYGRVFFMQVAALAVFAVFFERLVPVSEELQAEAWWAFGILSISTVCVFSQVFKAKLEASQRGYLVSYIMTLQNLLYLGPAIALIYWGHGLMGQVVAYAGSTLVAMLLYIYLNRADLKLIKNAEVLASDDEALLKKQRKSLFLTEVCGRASLLSDNIIITFLMGAKPVTAFFLTQRLIQLVTQQLQHISNSTWPALGELYYQKKMDVFRARVLELTEVVAFFAGVTLSVLVFTNPSFVRLWTGEETFAGPWVSNLAVLNGGLFALTSLWGWCFSATNTTDKVVRVFAAQALVNVPASFVATYYLGVVGPLIGTLLGFTGVTVWWKTKLLSENFAISFAALTRAWVVPFLLPVGASIAVTVFWGYPRLDSWMEFILAFGLGHLVILALLYPVLLRADTRAFLRNRIKSLKRTRG